jgi:hypothetical protein
LRRCFDNRLRLVAVIVVGLALGGCATADRGETSSSLAPVETTTTFEATTSEATTAVVTTVVPTTIPSNTSSEPATTTAPPVFDDSRDTIGAAGCSVTSDGVVGYFAVGGTRFCNISGDYGGASVGMWARGSGGMWDAFESNLAEHPETKVLWWQLCTLNGSQRDGIDAAAIVLEELRARIPGVTIYVSAQPDYVPAGICDISGADGPSFMAEVAAALVADFDVLAGPMTGPLTEADTVGGCHASESGQILMGEQLLAAFG